MARGGPALPSVLHLNCLPTPPPSPETSLLVGLVPRSELIQFLQTHEDAGLPHKEQEGKVGPPVDLRGGRGSSAIWPQSTPTTRSLPCSHPSVTSLSLLLQAPSGQALGDACAISPVTLQLSPWTSLHQVNAGQVAQAHPALVVQRSCPPPHPLSYAA